MLNIKKLDNKKIEVAREIAVLLAFFAQGHCKRDLHGVHMKFKSFFRKDSFSNLRQSVKQFSKLPFQLQLDYINFITTKNRSPR